jgi:parvulin-like peptidyl-prolyl isomerase
MQQGKELGYSDKTEAELNRRMISLAKDQNINYEQLDEAMRAAGIDPGAFRADARRGIMTGMVFNEEVDRKLYFSLTPDEVRKYYDQNQAKFRKPETLTISEIFLSKAGKPEADVRALADRLVREARAGKDFGELATINSDRESSRANKGKIGAIAITDITKPEIAAAFKNLKAGEVTNPISSEEGYLIFRVDERTAAAPATFNEQEVRVALTEERSSKERVAYLNRLRDDAYLKIAEGYRAAVEEALNKSTKSASNTTTPAPAPVATPNTKRKQ